MKVENPINNLPTYESKPKDTPLSSIAPNYKEPTDPCMCLCAICVCIEYCCCALLGA